MGPQDMPTKQDNRRSLFLHRMQKKINHEDFEGALKVYRKLRTLRLDDHVGVFNKLFNLAIAQDDPAKIEQVLSEMDSANVQPISKTLEILLPYLIAKDMRDRVDTLVDQMKKHNVIIREADIQESLEEYLKRPRIEKEVPKKEKAMKKEKYTKEEKPTKTSKPTTFITNEKQLKKEVEKYWKNDVEGSPKKNKSSETDKKSKTKFDEDEEHEEKYEKKITKKGDSLRIKEKLSKTAVDSEGKTSNKVHTSEKFETSKPTKGDKKNKKQAVIEEEEFDDEEFDEDEMDDDEVIETTTEKKKKTKKVGKSGVKKVKKTVKKVKKVSK